MAQECQTQSQNFRAADLHLYTGLASWLLRILVLLSEGNSISLYLLHILLCNFSVMTKAKSMNYCETPKYQLDTLLKNFSEVRKATVTSWVWGLSSCLINNCLFEFENICFLFQAKYKDSYVQNVLGHYIGSFEDPYQVHCLKISAQNSDVSLKTIVHASQ